MHMGKWRVIVRKQQTHKVVYSTNVPEDIESAAEAIAHMEEKHPIYKRERDTYYYTVRYDR